MREKNKNKDFGEIRTREKEKGRQLQKKKRFKNLKSNKF